MDENTCICSMAEYYDVSVCGERKKKGSWVKMIFSDHFIHFIFITATRSCCYTPGKGININYLPLC